MPENENDHGKSGEHGHNDDNYIIVVNAEEHPANEKVTYEEVVRLAYPSAQDAPNVTYSVTFEHAQEPKQGTLAAGGSVLVKRRNTVFDVVQANRA